MAKGNYVALKVIARSAVTLGLAVGLTAGTACVAAAQPGLRTALPMCDREISMSLQSPGTQINAFNFKDCITSTGGDTETDYPTSIYQLSSSGQWILVASGSGAATYSCKGTTVRSYKGEGVQANWACG
jgi:hypothetical protein